MTREEWVEKAIAYFNGAMPQEEVRLFEKETAEDNELSQLMQLWKDTDEEAIAFEQNKENADAFITTHQKLKAAFINDQQADEFLLSKESNPGKSIFSAWKWIAAAAAISGIILLLKVTIQKPEDTTLARQEQKQIIAEKDSAAHLAEADKEAEKNQALPDKKKAGSATLYAQVFTKDEVPENQNGPLADAFFYYNSGQYKEAVAAIENAGDQAKTRGNNTITPLTNFYALYYKALSMMLLHNTAGAIPVLQQAVLQSPDPELTAKAHWYLALAYLKEEKNAFTMQTLQLLINNPDAGAYKNKAEKLLAALKK